MITKEILEAISNQFQSTFTLVDQNTITNLFTEDDCFEIEQIIKRHVQNVQIEFNRTNQLSIEPKATDVWIIRVMQS